MGDKAPRAQLSTQSKYIPSFGGKKKGGRGGKFQKKDFVISFGRNFVLFVENLLA